jgi:hypothetical protein
MTMFFSTASPGQRWKMFLPGTASHQCDAPNVSAAAALIRSQWLTNGAHRSPPLALDALASASRVGECLVSAPLLNN